MKEIKNFLEHTAYKMRVSSIVMTTMAGSGHPTSCLSAADLVAGLFFYAMSYDPHDPENSCNDRFILSKGHASPLLYAAWKEAGALTEKDLEGYRTFNSVLEGHPTRRFNYTEGATGSLGMGLSLGVGMALSARQTQRNYYTYVLMGDSELAEGSIWEAAQLASFYRLNSLVGIVDVNRLGQSTETVHGHHLHRYEQKFLAFGWDVITIDGHDMNDIMHSLDKARLSVDKPTVILAKTDKGHGIARVQDKEYFHGKPFGKDELASILKELENYYKDIMLSSSQNNYSWQPKLPEITGTQKLSCALEQMKDPAYKKGELIATRKTFGVALTDLGRVCESVVSLDAEVKNSTYAEIFEERFPERFYQCFIAEQNMIGMATGFDRRGHIVFASTFGAFFSRAYDQIRMAAIGQSTIKLVGSHAGVSIGQDGPSQMALEDIALMSALPNSIILYPSDAVSTHACVRLMAGYTGGVSYLRTTRASTPVIYNNYDEFSIGGCQIVRSSEQDKMCIIAAGITVHEALKAYDILLAEGINISIIDAYSIKPLAREIILEIINRSNNKVITVEDHYIQGGLGQTVVYELRDTNILIDCLAVTQVPRSGTPEELLAWAGIDAQAIIQRVKELL